MTAAQISGTAVDLRHGRYVAAIATVGASLRTLTADGRDLVVPWRADEVRPRFRGAVLVPWPNRVVDGRYTFDGELQQLALTEPERGHALHGLVCWTDFRIVRQGPAAVELEAGVPAQAGYPHRLLVRVRYALDDDGLTVTITTKNTGPTRTPYGASWHPYLVAGAGRVDDWALTLGAAAVLQVTPDRLIPTGTAPVAGGPFDFASGRPIGDLLVDHAFTALAAGEARLVAADGHGVGMSWDPSVAPWVQVHTADRPEPADDRVGLAVEPMTCPPDAFTSGTDLVVLDPGATHTLELRLAAL